MKQEDLIIKKTMLNNKKSEQLLQSFFDLLLGALDEPLLSLDDKEALQEKVTNLINNGHPKFKEEMNEVLMRRWIIDNKKLRINNTMLEREWAMLWLNYSPKNITEGKLI